MIITNATSRAEIESNFAVQYPHLLHAQIGWHGGPLFREVPIDESHSDIEPYEVANYQRKTREEREIVAAQLQKARRKEESRSGRTGTVSDPYVRTVTRDQCARIAIEAKRLNCPELVSIATYAVMRLGVDPDDSQKDREVRTCLRAQIWLNIGSPLSEFIQYRLMDAPMRGQWTNRRNQNRQPKPMPAMIVRRILAGRFGPVTVYDGHRMFERGRDLLGWEKQGLFPTLQAALDKCKPGSAVVCHGKHWLTVLL